MVYENHRKPNLKVIVMESQNDKIRQHLEAGYTITPLEALQLFGCLRLSGRIYDLIHEGLPVNSEMIEINGKRIARYSLPKAHLKNIKQNQTCGCPG